MQNGVVFVRDRTVDFAFFKIEVVDVVLQRTHALSHAGLD